MKILTAAQMGEVDRLSTEIYRIPSLLLMENAGRAVADELRRAVPDLIHKRTVILCGKGNNGGDGFVVARHLSLHGIEPELVLFADPSALKGDALTNWNIVKSIGLRAQALPLESQAKAVLRNMPSPQVIVDALFGTGLSKPIKAPYKHIVEWINRARSAALIASVDIPSGLFADSPSVSGVAVEADLTVTFTAPKLSLVMPPAADHTGRLVVAPIGSPDALMENPEFRMSLIDKTFIQPALPARAHDSHKGTFGHVYVMAGSRAKSGAALMTGMGALRSGAGLVTLLLPESMRKDVVGKFPELMTEFLPETVTGTIAFEAVEKILALASQADALVVGPGLSTQESTRAAVREVVHRSPAPVVLDADGINAFASDAGAIHNMNGKAIAITPHPGEMARLLGSTISRVQKWRLDTARDLAGKSHFFVILKGFQTIVAAPTGDIFINTTGNPGMATGGSGDVLSGITGRFMAGWNRKFHGADLKELSRCLSAAVYLHGLAGDLAAKEKGEESMIATDLLPYLAGAFKTVAHA
jgi:hydroxyethylthiazole kinase-like uncharacterized protein yjeF